MLEISCNLSAQFKRTCSCWGWPWNHAVCCSFVWQPWLPWIVISWLLHSTCRTPWAAAVILTRVTILCADRPCVTTTAWAHGHLCQGMEYSLRMFYIVQISAAFQDLIRKYKKIYIYRYIKQSCFWMQDVLWCYYCFKEDRGHILFFEYFSVKKYMKVFQNSKADFDILCYRKSPVLSKN